MAKQICKQEHCQVKPNSNKYGGFCSSHRHLYQAISKTENQIQKLTADLEKLKKGVTTKGIDSPVPSLTKDQEVYMEEFMDGKCFKVPEDSFYNRFCLYPQEVSSEASRDFELFDAEFKKYTSELENFEHVISVIEGVSIGNGNAWSFLNEDRQLEKKYETIEVLLSSLADDYTSFGIRDSASRGKICEWLEELRLDKNKVDDWYHSVL